MLCFVIDEIHEIDELFSAMQRKLGDRRVGVMPAKSCNKKGNGNAI